MKHSAWAVVTILGISLSVAGCGSGRELQVLQPLKLPLDRAGQPDRAAIPWPVRSDEFLDPGWVGRLTPYDTGPGVAVCEPASAGDAAAVAVGKGAARWLQLALSSQTALERMPTFGSVTKVMERGAVPFALTPAVARRIAAVTGATHAVTTQVTGSAQQMQLALQLYSLPDAKPIGKPLRFGGSPQQVAARLPSAVEQLMHGLGAKLEGVLPKAESVGALRVVGSLPRTTSAEAAKVSAEAQRLAKTSDLAALMVIEASSASQDQRLAADLLGGLPGRAKDNPAFWASGGRASIRLQFQSSPEDLAGGMAVLKARPHSYLANLAAAALWGCARQPAEATAHATEAVRCNPNNPEGWRMLAEHLSTQAHAIRRSRYYPELNSEESDGIQPLYRGWTRAARKSTEIDPAGPENWLVLSMGATPAGDYATAEDALWRAMKQRPLAYNVVEWGLILYSPSWRNDPRKLRKVQEAAASAPLASPRDRALVLATLRQYSRFDLVRRMTGAPAPRVATSVEAPPEFNEAPEPQPRPASAPPKSELAARRKQLDELAEVALKNSGVELGLIEPEAAPASPAASTGRTTGAPEPSTGSDAPPISIKSISGARPPDANHVLARSRATLFALAWDPSGRRLAAGGRSGTLFLVEGGKRTDLVGHRGSVYAVAWSPDGTTLASCGADGTIRIWDAAAGKASAVLKGHSGPVRSLDWGGSGRLASAGDDRTVRIWDVPRKAQIRLLTGHSRLAGGVAFSPGGRQLFSTSARAGVGEGIIWDPATGKPTRKLQISPGFLQSIAWSPDGKSVAVVQPSSIVVLDAASGSVLREEKPKGSYTPISLLWREGCGLIAGIGDRKLLTIQPGTHGLPASIDTGDSLPTAIAWNARTSRLTTAQNNGLVREWTGETAGEGVKP